MSSDTIRKLISDELGIPHHLLNRLIKRAPHTYKVYTIPKKTTGRRTIAQPARETKYLQEWLIKNIFCFLPLHERATAYKLGASIKNNAAIHAKNSYLAKFDFKDFFTSIKEGFVRNHLERHLAHKLSAEDIDDIVRICCIQFSGKDHKCLSIGAPSSPVLSNTIMYEFDQKVFDWCTKNEIEYSRYADDLTFSTNTPSLLHSIEDVIRKIVRKLEYPTLRFNRKKTTYVSKKYQRRVTGLVLSNEGSVSLGRARKRAISALVHKYSLNVLDDKEKYSLQGMLSFAFDVEPLFIARLRGKYGSPTIDDIFSLRKKPIS